MNMKNKYIGIFVILIFSLLSSCNNFDEMNTNPDTTTNVSASMLCTNVVLNIAQFQGKDAKAMISDNALCKYVGYANEGQMGTQYNTVGSAGFDIMTTLPNIEKMVLYATGSQNENSYKGVAKFARAFLFYRLTMQLGDIPYSEAGMGEEGNFRIKYDTQEAVFKGILDELKEADQFFANGTTFTGDPTPYNGNPAKWRSATNALALKVLMSLSKKEGVASLNVKTRFAEIVAANNIMGSTSAVSYTHLRAHETRHDLVCRLLLEKKKK